jgi:hypothetical protein
MHNTISTVKKVLVRVLLDGRKEVEGVGCKMEKYYIITVEVRKILLNKTNESASPLFHHYRRLLRTRTHAMSNPSNTPCTKLSTLFCF